MTQPMTTQPTATEPPARKLNLRRLERLRRLLQYGAALVLAVFVALIFVASRQLKDITGKIESAKLEQANLQKDIATLSEQRKTLQTQVEVQGGALSTVRAQSEEAKALVDEALKVSSEEALKKTGAEAAGPAQLPPLVYIQIGRPDQRPKALEVAGQLKAKGYSVPGIENVGARAKGKSDIRFCGDPNSKDVADITGQLAAAGVALEKQPLPSSVCAKIRPRQYELWFCDDFPPGSAPATTPDADARPDLPLRDRPRRDEPRPAASPNVNRPTPERVRPRRQSP